MKELLGSIIGIFNPIDDVYGFIKTVTLLIVGGLLAIVPSCASYKAGYQLGWTKAKLFGQENDSEIVEPVDPGTGVPNPLGDLID